MQKGIGSLRGVCFAKESEEDEEDYIECRSEGSDPWSIHCTELFVGVILSPYGKVIGSTVAS